MGDNRKKITGYVYLLVTEYEYDGEHGVDIEAFKKFGNASAAFKMAVRSEKETSWIKDCDDAVIEEDELSFTAYVDGEYSETHTSIYVQKVETYD